MSSQLDEKMSSVQLDSNCPNEEKSSPQEGNKTDTGTVAEEEEDIVDPWNVTSKSLTGVDYDKLISKLPTQF